MDLCSSSAVHCCVVKTTQHHSWELIYRHQTYEVLSTTQAQAPRKPLIRFIQVVSLDWNAYITYMLCCQHVYITNITEITKQLSPSLKKSTLTEVSQQMPSKVSNNSTFHLQTVMLFVPFINICLFWFPVLQIILEIM